MSGDGDGVGGGRVSKYLSQMVEDACSALAQPVAADGTVADPQAGRTRPLRVLKQIIKN